MHVKALNDALEAAVYRHQIDSIIALTERGASLVLSAFAALTDDYAVRKVHVEVLEVLIKQRIMPPCTLLQSVLRLLTDGAYESSIESMEHGTRMIHVLIHQGHVLTPVDVNLQSNRHQRANIVYMAAKLGNKCILETILDTWRLTLIEDSVLQQSEEQQRPSVVQKRMWCPFF